jgi:hypothetical protein
MALPEFMRSDTQQFRDLWCSDQSVTDIAREYGTHQTSVSAAAKARGYASRHSGRFEISRADLVALWCGGLSLAALAKQVGYSEHVIRQRAKGFGLPCRHTAHDRGYEAVLAGPSAVAAPLTAASDYSPACSNHVMLVPFWTPARDARVVETRGRYGALAKLAVSLGESSSRVIARWHVLRVAQ